MNPEISFGNVELQTSAAPAEARLEEPRRSFRIVILGDFSGRGSRGVVRPADQLREMRPRSIDRDNSEALIAKLGTELRVPVDQATGNITLSPKSLEEFHPDCIYDGLELFASLRKLRRRLSNPSTFRDAVAELEANEPAAVSEPAEPEPSDYSTEGLFDQMIEETQSQQPEPGDWDALVRDIVEPYSVPGKDPEQDEWVAKVDVATADQMRRIVHHPVFKQAEASWRSLQWLVRRLDTGKQLKVSILDVSRAELVGDLIHREDLRDSSLYKVLVDPVLGTGGGDAWSLVVADYLFGRSDSDIEMIARLARLSAVMGAAFVGGAESSVFGCPSLAGGADPSDWNDTLTNQDKWEALCGLAESGFAGLMSPRFLCRLPYESGSNPTESFQWQECSSPPKHEEFLWGNPAYLAAYLLGNAFSQDGWEMTPGGFPDVTSMPFYTYRVDDEVQMKPCAEVFLTESGAERMRGFGLTPVFSVRGSDSVRIVQLHSLRGGSLQGPW